MKEVRLDPMTWDRGAGLYQPDFTTCGQGNTLATWSTKSPPLYPVNALIARLVERISSMEEI
jgi:hypothetical protein